MTDQPDDDDVECEFERYAPPPDDGEIHDGIGPTELSHVVDGVRVREIAHGVLNHKPKKENQR